MYLVIGSGTLCLSRHLAEIESPDLQPSGFGRAVSSELSRLGVVAGAQFEGGSNAPYQRHNSSDSRTCCWNRVDQNQESLAVWRCCDLIQATLNSETKPDFLKLKRTDSGKWTENSDYNNADRYLRKLQG
jgi:hypothetical protein